jgi:serine---pyruvate transaminase
MPQKRYLVTPGPTPVPPEVWAAMSGPMLHHRGPEFTAILARVRSRLQEVMRTTGTVVLFPSGGTGAMEAAISNLCSPDDRVVVAAAGYFGERWLALAHAYGLDVVEVRYAWGETVQPEDLAAALDEAGGATAVYLTHSETSTGVVHDVQALAEAVADSGVLVVVDAVSSLAALPLETDAWELDVVVSGSQKALMTPPGVAFSSLSPVAREAAGSASLPRFSLDWKRVDALGSTPAVTIVQGLDAALELLLAEGVEAAFDRHVRLGRACRAGAKAMGLELFSPDEDRSAVVTAIRLPEGVEDRAILRTMRERSGVTAIGGQGEIEGRVVRIGHVGYVDVHDVGAALAALEGALVETGADVSRGVAVDAALEAYAAPVRA